MTAPFYVSAEPTAVREEPLADRRCARLSNGRVSVWATLDVGPRVLGFALDDGPLAGVNAFADRLGTVLDRPNGRPCALVGGHRLWTAPEDRGRTYQPDDLPVELNASGGRLRLVGPTEVETGLRRTIQVTLDGAGAVVDHWVENRGSDDVHVAPWAITMLPPGGTAVVPLPQGPESGLLPDRLLVLWPYTHLGDPRLGLGDRAVRVRADGDAERPIKVGASGVRALAYFRAGAPTFVVRTEPTAGADYPDLGCDAEVYANAQFCELETLGPLVTLASGDGASHRERWSLHDPAVPPTNDVTTLSLMAPFLP